jgi:hypothetical protein
VKRRIAISAAVLHLLLVTCGALRVTPLPPETSAGSATRLYMGLSGADGYYGFFAPGVGPQIRIRLRVVDRDGDSRFVPLRAGNSAEADLRRVGIGRLLPDLNPQQNRDLLRSLAAAAFQQAPDADRVDCLVEIYGVVQPDGVVAFPSMQEYRRGTKPGWVNVDGITFTRSSNAGEAAGNEAVVEVGSEV